MRTPPGPPVTKICACGKSFTRRASIAAKQRFCSAVCGRKYAGQFPGSYTESDEPDHAPITHLRRVGDEKDLEYLETVKINWERVGQVLMDLADRQEERRKRNYVRRSQHNG